MTSNNEIIINDEKCLMGLNLQFIFFDIVKKKNLGKYLKYLN